MRYLSLLLLAFAAPAAADLFALTETRELTLPTAGLGMLEIRNDHGYIVVEGDPDRTDIAVSAELWIPARDRLRAKKLMYEHLNLSLVVRDGAARLEGDFGSLHRTFGQGPRVSLTVHMPADLDLTIVDGTGYIEVSDIEGAVSVEDGSGSITLTNIGGAVSIDDGAGWIDVDRTGSTVEIKDRSGGISVSRVTSDVLVDDGSGHIAVRDIGGDLRILDDAGGRVSFSGIDGVIRDDS